MKAKTKETRSRQDAAAAIPCGALCDSYGCWKKCRRPDGHGGSHECDEHGGSS